MTYDTIEQIVAANRARGGFFFSEGAMGFFNSVVGSQVVHGRYFVTGEAMEHDEPRRWAIRWALPDGSIEDVGGFHLHGSRAEALDAAQQLPPTGFCCTRQATLWRTSRDTSWQHSEACGTGAAEAAAVQLGAAGAGRGRLHPTDVTT